MTVNPKGPAEGAEIWICPKHGPTGLKLPDEGDVSYCPTYTTANGSEQCEVQLESVTLYPSPQSEAGLRKRVEAEVEWLRGPHGAKKDPVEPVEAAALEMAADRLTALLTDPEESR